MTKTRIYHTGYPTKLQAGACWMGPYQAALRDTSCASKKPDWHSRHAAVPHVLPTPGYQRLFDDASLFFDRPFLPLFYRAGDLNGLLLECVHLPLVDT